MSELYKQILQTPETFRRSRASPDLPPVKAQLPTLSDDMFSEIPETDTSKHEVSDSDPLYSEAVAPRDGRVSIPGQDAFITSRDVLAGGRLLEHQILGRQ